MEEQQQVQKESIQNYQIAISDDIDFLKILEILKKNNFDEKYAINKKYVHSLFTPLLSFIIEYLNNSKENKNKFIGKSKVFDIPVIYSLLNKEVYNLFFKKEKGKIFEGNEEINYEFESENENYYISSIKEKIINEQVLKDSLKEFIGEEVNSLENQTIEKMLTLKRREIISMFRLGYSLQERIVNYMHAKSGNQLIELPNIIFYKANKEKKLFNEMDRIITVKEDIQIDEFLVYLKAEFSPGNKNNIKIDEMENLAKLYLRFL